MSDEPTKQPQFGVPHFEGHLQIDAGNLYYREFGSGENVLVGLHGGPGAAHDYLAPLTDVASDEWTVFLYDQYGGGRSDRPADAAFDDITIEGFRDRLEQVRQAIGRETIHLYGQSWGGWLALAYAVEYPDRVGSLTIANSSADTDAAAAAMWEAALDCLETDAEREELRKIVAERRFDDDAYSEYVDRFTDVHVNRSDEDPFVFSPPTESKVYGVMWGSSEFNMAETARLRGWSVTDRLDEITCPTLVLNGEYDEIAPALGRELADGLPNGQFVEFADASHLPLWEARDEHLSILRDFLASVVE